MSMNETARRLRAGALRLASFLPHRLRRLAADERGMSAIEFGFVLPLMVTLYFGVVELSEGIAIDRKVTLTARTIADLVSQQSVALDTTTRDNLLNAAAAVIAPYPITNGAGTAVLKIVVSQIATDTSGNSTVQWSVTKNGTALTKNASYTLPAAYTVANTASWIILGQAEYDYTPSFVGRFLVATSLTLTDRIYMRARQLNCIQYNDGSTTTPSSPC